MAKPNYAFEKRQKDLAKKKKKEDKRLKKLAASKSASDLEANSTDEAESNKDA
jgi:hypothetical protein